MKLVLLRELYLETKLKKDNCLEAGITKTADQLAEIEKTIHSHVFSAELSDDLNQLLSKAADPSNLTPRPDLPASFVAALGLAGKLEGTEKDWDVMIAHHATMEGWIFGSLDFTVNRQELSRWQERLHNSAWPTGTVLFAGEAKPSQEPEHFHGRWYICYDFRFPSPDSWWKEIRNWPGSSISDAEEIDWKVLFPPEAV